MQARDTCKLLCCVAGKPTPTVSNPNLTFCALRLEFRSHVTFHRRDRLLIFLFFPSQIKWFKEGRELSKYEYTMQHSDGVVTMEIVDCKPSDSGNYRCIATNVHGKDETSCVVIVEGE